MDEIKREESRILGVSVRGWMALMLTYTACIQSSFGLTIKEPLYSLVLMAVGFYLGQKTK